VPLPTWVNILFCSTVSMIHHSESSNKRGTP